VVADKLCDPRTLEVDLEVQVFGWDCCSHSSSADPVDVHSLGFYRSLAAGTSREAALYEPVAQENGQSCSVNDFVIFEVFGLSLFVRGRAEERRRRCCEKLHLVGLVGNQAQVGCRNLYSWVHTGAPLACQTPPYSAKRWRASSKFIFCTRWGYSCVFFQGEPGMSGDGGGPIPRLTSAIHCDEYVVVAIFAFGCRRSQMAVRGR
jgi:hypothetical protein